MHLDSLRSIMKSAPSGAGIDAGTQLNTEMSTSEKLVFNTSFHHMNDAGCYDGWTEHTVIVRASLTEGIELRVQGRNRNDVKDYLHAVFYHWLRELTDA